MIGLSKAPTSWRSWLGLMGWLSLTFAAAVFGGQFTPGPWYAQLAKPGITPPAWVFGPVWTALYAMMAVAAWLVWKQRGFAGASLALTLFIVQLALNALWSWIFFGLHNPGLALAEIQLLWLAVLATLLAFRRHHKTAGLLLLPYLIWVTFAVVLNFLIRQMNA